jgi:hypothetical protein
MIFKAAKKLFGGVLLFALGLFLVLLACVKHGCSGIPALYVDDFMEVLGTPKEGSGTAVPLEKGESSAVE